jgi:hypothetical protein
LNNLAVVLLNQGNLEEATACCERALKIFKKFLGDDHPKTRLVQNNLDALAIIENKPKKSR